MRKLAYGLLIVVLIGHTYMIQRMFRFNRAAADYVQYLSVGLDCVIKQNGNDRNDTYLAAKGKTREELTGDMAEILPVRRAYDLQIPACRELAEYRCWILTPNNHEKCAESIE